MIDENEEPVGIEIVKDEAHNLIDENCSIIFVESDEEEEGKERTKKMFSCFKIL